MMAAHEGFCSGHFVNLMLIDWSECGGMKTRSEQSFLSIECGHNNSFKTRAHSGLHALSSYMSTPNQPLNCQQFATFSLNQRVFLGGFRPLMGEMRCKPSQLIDPPWLDDGAYLYAQNG
ncbi:hypothetical protein HUJ05_009110 [Dendroctonus ponderosae]|nr:hypothetical protein HUJ05_009110 [Dendroctonus ponderosae]